MYITQMKYGRNTERKLKVIIRKCEYSDIEAARAFYDEQVLYMDENNANYPLWIYKEYPSENSVRRCTENGSQYVCVDGGKICAAFVLNEEPGGRYENGAWRVGLKRGEYLVIHTLSTDHNLSGRGIGTRAVEFCLNTARRSGYKAVRIDVVPTNIPAIRLYEKIGFTFAGTVDLERGIENIPYFSLYEYNFQISER